MNPDWGLIVVIGMALVLGALIGFVARSWMAEARLEQIDATYDQLHQHIHATLGLRAPKRSAQRQNAVSPTRRRTHTVESWTK